MLASAAGNDYNKIYLSRDTRGVLPKSLSENNICKTISIKKGLLRGGPFFVAVGVAYADGTDLPSFRTVRFLVISTTAGTIYVAHETPRIIPVTNRERWVFSHIPKIVSDQSTAIGMSDKNSHMRGSGSISSIGRQSG